MPTELRASQPGNILVWLVLMLSILGSWFLLDSLAFTLVTVVVIALAALKVVLVIAYYMEVSDAPLWLKALCGIWVLLVFTMISVSHVAPGVDAGPTGKLMA